MGPNSEGNWISNCVTDDIMPLRIDRGAEVFKVEFEGSEKGSITVDAGVDERLAGSVGSCLPQTSGCG